MRWFPLTLLVVVAGCGSAPRGVVQPVARHASRTCTPAAPGFRTCFANARKQRSTIERLVGSKWVVIAGPLPHSDPVAEWGPKVWLSPDRQTVLAEWEFPCDSAVAVFVPAGGGAPLVVTGQSDWRKAPISRPLGWTKYGKARVSVLGKRAVQLIDPRSVRRLRVKPTSC